MFGLARMALRLACHRVYQDADMADSIMLAPRRHVVPNGVSANAEYYRIIDRITRGEKP